ncbi:hypothetical protein AK812_SmicGene35773 [Symbiodinium microadriaticum]|uniref:Uncharacterized protein n=1 Tax=Symbiodinium microadriaticum TaxID=2951 RepID=A0A1Q9CKK4_SYMMI|nr:hypothetical protein AK812_SmicGene35773 [Symbiodinium microadriaticum]
MPNHKRARKRGALTCSPRRSGSSVWYTFVDAVSGFNQIRNTKRAREVLAIVARSGKYLPGRRLRYTKEWIAYVDDLTVRTGRVVDGKFYTDSVADQALGFKPKPESDKRAHHDAARAFVIGGGDEHRGGSSRREPAPKGGGRQAPRGDDGGRGGGGRPAPREGQRQAERRRRARAPARPSSPSQRVWLPRLV